MSTEQWTFLALGLGFLAFGGSGLRWAEAWEGHGVKAKPFGISGTSALMCVIGVLFLIGIAAAGVGTFVACIGRSSQGLGWLAGDVFWVVIATFALVEGITEHDRASFGVAAFMFSVVGLFGLLTWVFHSEHLWVKPISDFIGCF